MLSHLQTDDDAGILTHRGFSTSLRRLQEARPDVEVTVVPGHRDIAGDPNNAADSAGDLHAKDQAQRREQRRIVIGAESSVVIREVRAHGWLAQFDLKEAKSSDQ